MDPVSMLIFNALAQRRGVNLPGVGSFNLLTTPARVETNGHVTAPTSEVNFSTDEIEGYASILHLIGESSGKGEERCREIYDTWLTRIRSGNGFDIESVGVLRDGVFIPYPELSRMLNPAGLDPIPLKKQVTTRTKAGWIVGAVLLGGLLMAAAILFFNNRQNNYTPPKGRAAQSETALPAVDSTTAVEASTPAAEPEAIPATTPKPAESKSAAQPPTTTAATPTAGGGRYYVIIGVFSNAENAEKCVAETKRRDATLNPGKLPLSTGKTMVYTAEASTEALAAEHRRGILHLYPDAWVYKRAPR